MSRLFAWRARRSTEEECLAGTVIGQNVFLDFSEILPAAIRSCTEGAEKDGQKNPGIRPLAGRFFLRRSRMGEVN